MHPQENDGTTEARAARSMRLVLVAWGAVVALLLWLPGCSETTTVAWDDDDASDDDLADDDTADDDADACPVEDYPDLSPDCELFLDNPIDGIQPVLNRTTACDDPPPLGQPAQVCWDDGPSGTERYLGFCINIDDRGVCVPGHLGLDASETQVVWDDQLDCIPGETSITTAGAKTCVPLCVGQGDQDVGAPCAGNRACVKMGTDSGEQVVCGGD